MEQNLKSLIVVAHYGEAHEFIKMYNMKRISTVQATQLYQSEEIDLLILGEGLIKALTQLTIFLAKNALTRFRLVR